QRNAIYQRSGGNVSRRAGGSPARHPQIQLFSLQRIRGDGSGRQTGQAILVRKEPEVEVENCLPRSLLSWQYSDSAIIVRPGALPKSLWSAADRISPDSCARFLSSSRMQSLYGRGSGRGNPAPGTGNDRGVYLRTHHRIVGRRDGSDPRVLS